MTESLSSDNYLRALYLCKAIIIFIFPYFEDDLFQYHLQPSIIQFQLAIICTELNGIFDCMHDAEGTFQCAYLSFQK